MLLTPTQITQLQKTRETLTSVQTKMQTCTSKDFDQGRVVQACANAELALFELINLSQTLDEMEAAMRAVAS